jgi:hypothetical protein
LFQLLLWLEGISTNICLDFCKFKEVESCDPFRKAYLSSAHDALDLRVLLASVSSLWSTDDVSGMRLELDFLMNEGASLFTETIEGI